MDTYYLFLFDGTNWKTYDTANSSIPTNEIENLAIDNNDNVWFYYDDNSGKKQIIKLDVNNQFSVYDSSNTPFMKTDDLGSVDTISTAIEKNYSSSTNNSLINYISYHNGILYSLIPKSNRASISLYDMSGRLLLSKKINQMGGKKEVLMDLNSMNISSGVYLCRINSGSIIETKKFSFNKR